MKFKTSYIFLNTQKNKIHTVPLCDIMKKNMKKELNQQLKVYQWEPGFCNVVFIITMFNKTSFLS